MSTDIQSITHRFEVGGHQPATPNRLGCVDRGLRPFIEPLAGPGWCQTACRADEQRYTQLGLELCDGLRYGRLSDLHPASGRGKRAGLDHTHEGLHRAESVHFPYVSTVE